MKFFRPLPLIAGLMLASGSMPALAGNEKIEKLAELLETHGGDKLKSCKPDVSAKYFYFKRSENYVVYTTEPKIVCFRVEQPNRNPSTYIELVSKSQLEGTDFKMLSDNDPWLIYKPLAPRADMSQTELLASGALIVSEDMVAAIKRGQQILQIHQDIETMQNYVPRYSDPFEPF